MNSPWLTIQHAAIGALPPGDHNIELSPGNLCGERESGFLESASWEPDHQVRDPANPAVVTCTGDKYVIRFAGDIGIRL